MAPTHHPMTDYTLPPPPGPKTQRRYDEPPYDPQIIVYRFPDGQARLRLANHKGHHHDDAPESFDATHRLAVQFAAFLEWPLRIIDLP